MELELAGKADTTAIPDVSNFITSADLPDTTGFALSSAIPDISSFITNSTNSLANYDTSTEVDSKVSTALAGFNTSSHTIDTDPAITGVRTYLRTIRLPEIDPFYPDDPYTITQQSVSFLIPNVSYTKQELIDIFFNKIDEILASTASTNSFSYTKQGVQQTSSGYEMEITLPYFAYGTQMVVGSGTDDLGIGFEVDMPTSLRNIFGLDSSTVYRFVNLTGSAGQPATATHRLTIPINISSYGTSDYINDALANYDTSAEVDTKLASVGGGGGGGVWDEGSGGDIYYNDGYIGIGTNNPHVPIHIVGSITGTSSNPVLTGLGALNYIAYLGDADTVYRTPVFDHSQYGSYESETSFYCTGDLLSGGLLGSYGGTISASDRRIKKEIVDIEDGLALERLRLLKPKQYQYVDEFKRGTEPVWGFIAQEVRETLPYATKLRTECLPNIYEVANVSASNVITLTNFDTSTLESNAMVLKVYDTENKEHLVNIAEVIDGHSVRVNEDLTEWTEDDKIFVYGQQVQDFVMLQKEAIFTIATSALQEVDRQLQAEKDKVASLEARISALEKK
jgi:hypothetical protein